MKILPLPQLIVAEAAVVALGGTAIVACWLLRAERSRLADERAKARLRYPSDDRQALLSNLAVASANIIFNKTVQWNSVYYVVALLGASAALAKTYGHTVIGLALSCLIAAVTFPTGVAFLLRLLGDIRAERLSVIRTRFALSATTGEKEWWRSEYRRALRLTTHPQLLLVFLCTLVLGLLVAAFAVYQAVSTYHQFGV